MARGVPHRAAGLVRLVTLHGWGYPAEGYSRLLHQRLGKLLGPVRLTELRYAELTRWMVLVPLLYRITPAGRRVRAQVRQALEAARLGGEPVIFVTHSYGTLIAFDVGHLPVDLFVTMDLRIQWLRPFHRRPTGMTTWANLYSPRSWVGAKLARTWFFAHDLAVDVASTGGFLGLRHHTGFWESAKVAAEIAFAWKASHHYSREVI